jgi:Cu/Ag efflux pump CusA
MPSWLVKTCSIIAKGVRNHGIKAAVDGTREIATPVTFSVLTNIVAFAPLFFVSGFMGKVFKQIPVVVIAVFAVSLIESLVILPAHIGHQRRSAPTSGLFGWLFNQQRRFSDWFSRMVRTRYGPFSGSGLEKPLHCHEPGGLLCCWSPSASLEAGAWGSNCFPSWSRTTPL